jgi:hypothetical protein
MNTAIPAAVRHSPLMRQGGFGVYEGLAERGVLAAMLDESVALSRNAAACDVRMSDGEEFRGGRPARRFLTGPGGPVQQRFSAAPSVLGFLRSVTHHSLQPTGELGTYSYYARPGDYLAVHRDIVTCDVAVITCLSDAPQTARGGGLCLYPDRLFEPLSWIRATPSQGACVVKLTAGQTIVLYGGLVPHALQPVDAGQVRIVSVLCYRVF